MNVENYATDCENGASTSSLVSLTNCQNLLIIEKIRRKTVKYRHKNQWKNEMSDDTDTTIIKR